MGQSAPQLSTTGRESGLGGLILCRSGKDPLRPAEVGVLEGVDENEGQANNQRQEEDDVDDGPEGDGHGRLQKLDEISPGKTTRSRRGVAWPKGHARLHNGDLGGGLRVLVEPAGHERTHGVHRQTFALSQFDRGLDQCGSDPLTTEFRNGDRARKDGDAVVGHLNSDVTSSFAINDGVEALGGSLYFHGTTLVRWEAFRNLWRGSLLTD